MCIAQGDASLTRRKILPLPATQPPPPLDHHSALFLDIDGTLLEIASHPDRVQVPSDLPSLLRDLARQRGDALALVSGRPLRDIDRLFRPWRGAAAGLHGLEHRGADGSLDSVIDPAAAAALDRLRPRLKAVALTGSGLVLEDKDKTLALHYREAPQREPEVRARAEEMARQETTLRLMAGKMVVEFQPREINKGMAIAAFLDEPPFIGRSAIFIGDDVTDEDGFAEISRRDGIAIRVGPPARTRARYALPDVRAVRAWLAHNRQQA
jgi:trehalose 6-phosphate phosphatase